MLYEIKSYFSGKVLFSLETDSMKLCLEAAVQQKLDLRGADLHGAILRGAILRGADLSGADLSDAVLSGADLRGADLRDAILRDAVLSGADLRGADLRDAILRGADLRDAILRGADLRGAILRGADLRDADGKQLPRATPEQAVANLDKVREIILDDAARLEMTHWHSNGNEWVKRTCAEEAVCGTTHCLAGWLQVCSTEPALKVVSAELAGILSAPVAAKMFYRSNDEVMTWLNDRAYAK